MRKVVIALHGYNVGDKGKETIDKGRPAFEAKGWEWVDLDYGDTNMEALNDLNGPLGDVIGKMLSEFAQEAYVLILAHSNGNLIAAHAINNGDSHVQHFIAVNPALEDDWVFPEWLPAVDIFGTPGDFWTSIARLAPVDGWGDMSNGYEGTQDFVVYYNMEDDPYFPIHDHSQVFKDKEIQHWGPKMVTVAEARYDAWMSQLGVPGM